MAAGQRVAGAQWHPEVVVQETQPRTVDGKHRRNGACESDRQQGSVLGRHLVLSDPLIAKLGGNVSRNVTRAARSIRIA
jgi:hypothetical protein